MWNRIDLFVVAGSEPEHLLGVRVSRDAVDARDMLQVRVGRTKMARQNYKKVLNFMLIVVPLIVIIIFILQRSHQPFKDDLRRALYGDFEKAQKDGKPPKLSAGPCVKRDCPNDHFSFYILSGAANVVAPKICLKNKLVLGTTLNNAGMGINIVVISGKTGEVTKTGNFDMYNGEVEPLIVLLKNISHGSVVLIASYDEPSTKLNDEARKLIAELGSTSVTSLGFRDSWVFVGGKGASIKNNFEKYVKNEKEKNKYEDWPELIELEGCIPKYME